VLKRGVCFHSLSVEGTLTQWEVKGRDLRCCTPRHSNGCEDQGELWQLCTPGQAGEETAA
jgi:hypothetical protein